MRDVRPPGGRAHPRVPLLLAAALLAAPCVGSELTAQSLLSAGGLGIPSGAPDARSRMLGGVGIGLSGGYLSGTDPAAAGWLRLSGVTGSVSSSTNTPNMMAPENGGALFPGIGFVWVAGRNVFSLNFNGFLSQEWDSREERTLELGGDSVRVLDRFEGKGGIGSVRVGWARSFHERLSVGVAAGGLVGSIEREFTRELDPLGAGADVIPFQLRGFWRATAPSVVAGVNWDVTSLVRLSGSVTWNGDLSLTPARGTDVAPLDVPLPVELRAGTYAALTPTLGLHASASRADWGDAARALGDEAAPGVVWHWGTGIEWTGASLLGRQVPLGIGYQERDLPFSFLGNAATEESFNFGLGVGFADSQLGPLARLHVSAERGSRSGGPWNEDFWRATFTLSISGR